MTTEYDQNTGEVYSGISIYDPDVALQTDTQMIAMSEQALCRIVQLLNAEFDIANTKELRAQAQAVNVLLSAHMHNRESCLEASNNLNEGRLRIERHTGAMIPQLQRDGVLATTGGDKKSLSSRSIMINTLPDYQITGDQSSLWQKAARIPDEVAEDYYATTKEGGGVITTTGLLRFARDKATHNAINQSENNEWYTPECYIEAARTVMGGIDLDPASCALANETIRANQIYTLIDSGLDHEWEGRVWLNPPYGRSEKTSNQHRWSAYLIEQYIARNVAQAVLLVNAVTDRSWFQAFWDYPICFVEKRIRFYNEDVLSGQPTHGNVFVYFGDNVTEFYHGFKQFGRIVMPARLYEEVAQCETTLIAT